MSIDILGIFGGLLGILVVVWVLAIVVVTVVAIGFILIQEGRDRKTERDNWNRINQTHFKW
jgi:uncharacterized membrane protein